MTRRTTMTDGRPCVEQVWYTRAGRQVTRITRRCALEGGFDRCSAETIYDVVHKAESRRDAKRLLALCEQKPEGVR